MPVLRSTVLVDAGLRTVAGVVRDSDTAAEAVRRAGHLFSADRRLLVVGDEVRVIVRVARVRVPLRNVVAAVSVTGITSSLVAGPRSSLAHTVTLTPTTVGTLLLDELSWTSPLGRLADALLLRGLMRRLLATRADVIVERVAALATAPVVVATAVVRDGRVLAAQRTRPPALAGRWELPGGRVEAGESEPDAVERECREELGGRVRATGRLGTDLPIDAGVLRVYTAELVDGSPEPRALEHAALRWVAPAELDGVDWVDADRAVVADLRAVLPGAGPAVTRAASG